MVGLPRGWAADYDGRRWFYTFTATGHAQYSFPNEGDEFPHHVDAWAPAPDAGPEGPLESAKPRRRPSGGGYKPPQAAASELAAQPHSSAAALHPVGGQWNSDLKAPHGLVVEVSPPPPTPPPAPAFDPVGVVAEMPSGDSQLPPRRPVPRRPVTHRVVRREPYELADNSILAPIERATTPLDKQDELDHPAAEADPPPSYQAYSPDPYSPDPSSTYLRPDRRRSQIAVMQRDISLNMSLKQPGNVELSAVPRVLSPPQMPARVPVPSETTRPASSHASHALLTPELAGDDIQKACLQQLAQPTATADTRRSFLPRHTRAQSHGALSKIPSVLKPARGKITMSQSQQQLLATPKRSSAPSPAPSPVPSPAPGTGRWTTTWEATSPPPPSAPPAYVAYQKGPDDDAASHTQQKWQAQESLLQTIGVARPRARQSPPLSPPPRQGPAPAPQQQSSARSASPERALRLPSPCSLRDVSPIHSRSESLSSRQPIRTPSPVDSFLRTSSTAPHLPGLAERPPAVPDKIPLEPADVSYFQSPTPPLGRDAQSQGHVKASSSTSSLPYSPDEYSTGYGAKPNTAQRSAVSVAPVPGTLQPGVPAPHEAAGQTANYKLSPIEEDGERLALLPKIVSQNAMAISVASGTTHAQQGRISSMQAQFEVSAGKKPQESSTPSREQGSEQPKSRASCDGKRSSPRMPSIRLVQSREGRRSAEAAPASRPLAVGKPLRAQPVGKRVSEPPQNGSTAFALESGGVKLAGGEKEKKWTKWFKSSRLSRSQKEETQFGRMADGPANGQTV